MKFWHKSNLLSCQMLSSTFTCNISNAGKMPGPLPINPKETTEKYEKLNMQILEEIKTEIRDQIKTNDIGGSL